MMRCTPKWLVSPNSYLIYRNYRNWLEIAAHPDDAYNQGHEKTLRNSQLIDPKKSPRKEANTINNHSLCQCSLIKSNWTKMSFKTWEWYSWSCLTTFKSPMDWFLNGISEYYSINGTLKLLKCSQKNTNYNQNQRRRKPRFKNKSINYLSSREMPISYP